MFLKQSTTYTDRIGPFLDKGDGVTEEVGLTTAASAIFLSKNGGDYGAKTEATALSHDQDGWYIILYDTTDTDTVGELKVMIQAPATHLPVWKTYYVLEEDAFDWLFASGSAPDTQVAAIPTTAMRGTDNVVLAGPTKGEMDTAHALLSTPAQVATALTDIDLDHLTKTAASIPSVTAGTFLDQMFDDGTAVFDRTTDSLQAIKDHAATIKTETALIVEDTDVIDDATSGLVKIAQDVAAILVDTKALNDDALSELAQGIPSATPTVKAALMLLYMMARNKLTVTATEKGIYNNAGTKIAKKVLSDDATTYEEAEAVSGV